MVNNIQYIQRLLKKDADLTLERIDNQTLLMAAASHGDILCVIFLLHYVSDRMKANAITEQERLNYINHAIAYQETALYLAVDFGHADCAKYLIDHGADLMLFKNNASYFFNAILNNNVACLKVLIDGLKAIAKKTFPNDVDAQKSYVIDIINIPHLMWKSTPVHLAANLGNFSCLQLLINEGADMLKPDCNGTTSLFVAFGEKPHKDECRKLLLTHLKKITTTEQERLDFINKKNNDGYTAFSFACWEDDDKSAQILLNAGADPNIRNDDEDTAFSIAMNPYRERKHALPVLLSHALAEHHLNLVQQLSHAMQPKRSQVLTEVVSFSKPLKPVPKTFLKNNNKRTGQ